MKLKILLTTLLLGQIFVGCSSTTKTQVSNSASSEDRLLDDDEFRNLENQDFQTKREVPFVEERDVYSDDFANADSLARESAARLPAPRLQNLANQKEPLSQLIALCYQGKFDEAFAAADRSYQTHKSHPNYWNQLGTCYFIQKNYRKALIYYNKALGLNGDYVPPINNMGVIYQNLGMDQKALLTFQKAYELNAFSATPAFNLGQIYLKYGFLDEAERIFIALRNKNQSDVDVNLALANVYLFKGDARRAVSLFASIDKRFHREPFYGLNYSVALKMGGRPKDAATVFKNISSEGLGNMTAYYQKVNAYINN